MASLKELAMMAVSKDELDRFSERDYETRYLMIHRHLKKAEVKSQTRQSNAKIK